MRFLLRQILPDLTAALMLSLMICACSTPAFVSTPWDRLNQQPEKQVKLRVSPEDCAARFPALRHPGFEMWYFDLICPDGRVLMIYFKTGSLYRGLPSLAEVGLHLYCPGEKPLIRTIASEAFQAESGRCEIRLGDCSLRGSFPDYSLSIKSDDLAVELAVTGIINGYKLTDNRVIFGPASRKPAFNDWVILMPRGIAEGSVTIGSKRITLKGDAYLDHWLGNVPLDRVYAACHWGKLYSERFSLIFLLARSESRFGDRPLGFLMLFDQDELVAATDRISIDFSDEEFSPVTRHTYPSRFTIQVDDSPGITGRIHGSLRSVLAEIDHLRSHFQGILSLLIPPARLILGSPYSYGLLSDARACLTIDGQPVEFTGLMFHEIDNRR
jgi:hypothetical protein